jgi:hypothetical protein
MEDRAVAEWSFPIGSEIATGCVAFDEPSNAVWFGTSDGGRFSIRRFEVKRFQAFHIPGV